MPTSIAARYMFVSGTAALIYEVLWVRDLAYTFGGSAEALSAVVAAFLAGLALGAWLAGRRVVARPGLLKLYARLELCIAIAGPLAPWAVVGLDRVVLDPIWPWLHAHGLATAARFVATFGVLLPATACMGATLPVLCTAFATAKEATGALIGRLYGWNTLGGVAGSLLAGFVLVEHVGLWKSRCVAAVLNLALAGAAWRRGKSGDGAVGAVKASAPMSAQTAGRSATGPAEVVRTPLAVPLWAAALVVSSALSIVLEFCWTRLVALGVGGTTYAFSIVLAVYLLGLGGGALVYAGAARRASNPVRVLALSQLALAGLLLALQPFIDDLLKAVGVSLFAANSVAGASPLAVRGGLALLLCSVVVLLPATLLGIAFPALSDLRIARREELGRGIGGAYVVSTIGGVAASVVTHFWLLPRFGLEATTAVSGLAIGLLGAVLWAVPQARGQSRGQSQGQSGGQSQQRAAWGRAGLAALMVIAGFGLVHWQGRIAVAGIGPLDWSCRWDQRAIYGGVGLYGAKALAPDRQLLEVRDGASCSVAVFAQKEERALSVNGKVDATTRGDMGTQLLLAWLPQLLCAEPREVFVLGYGAGVTAAAAAQLGSRVRCAEIEPEVLRMSHHFAAVNRNAETTAAIELVADDGRSLLRRDTRRFDVITTEPSNPWLAGMGSLFTVEFYELCRERLTDGGVLCQWVQLYWSSPEDYQAIFATLGSVFPHVAIWRTTSGDTLMLGSGRPLVLEREKLARHASERPWLAPMLAASGTQPRGTSLVAQLARMQLLCEADARRFADAGPRLICDDQPFLEFSAARHMQANSAEQILGALWSCRREPLYARDATLAAVTADERAPLLRDIAADALMNGAAPLAEPLLAEAVQLAPALERLAFWWWLSARKRGDANEAERRLAELVSRTPLLLCQVAEEHARCKEFERARALLDQLEKRVGATAAGELERGLVCERMGQRSDATTHYERSLKLDPNQREAREALRRLREAR